MSEAASPARVIKGGGWPGPAPPAGPRRSWRVSPAGLGAVLVVGALGAAAYDALSERFRAADDVPPEGLSPFYPPFARPVAPVSPDQAEAPPLSAPGTLEARPFGAPAPDAAPSEAAIADAPAESPSVIPPPAVSVAITREARIVHRVSPDYPAIARANRIQGTVVLQARVTATGEVASVEVVSGSPMLAAAAVRAVEQWRYEPALRDGEAIPALVTVTVNFTR